MTCHCIVRGFLTGICSGFCRGVSTGSSGHIDTVRRISAPCIYIEGSSINDSLTSYVVPIFAICIYMRAKSYCCICSCIDIERTTINGSRTIHDIKTICGRCLRLDIECTAIYVYRTIRANTFGRCRSLCLYIKFTIMDNNLTTSNTLTTNHISSYSAAHVSIRTPRCSSKRFRIERTTIHRNLTAYGMDPKPIRIVVCLGCIRQLITVFVNRIILFLIISGTRIVLGLIQLYVCTRRIHTGSISGS